MITRLNFDKWVDVLLFINKEGSYVADIGNKLGITWSHVAGISKLLAEKELINRGVKGNNYKIKFITLTKKGQKVQELLKEIKHIVRG